MNAQGWPALQWELPRVGGTRQQYEDRYSCCTFMLCVLCTYSQKALSPHAHSTCTSRVMLLCVGIHDAEPTRVDKGADWILTECSWAAFNSFYQINKELKIIPKFLCQQPSGGSWQKPAEGGGSLGQVHSQDTRQVSFFSIFSLVLCALCPMTLIPLN